VIDFQISYVFGYCLHFVATLKNTLFQLLSIMFIFSFHGLILCTSNTQHNFRITLCRSLSVLIARLKGGKYSLAQSPFRISNRPSVFSAIRLDSFHFNYIQDQGYNTKCFQAG
jgi:hypothetical protein